MAKTLTKRDLVNKISAETNFTQIEVFDIVQRAVDIISSTLAEGRQADRLQIIPTGIRQITPGASIKQWRRLFVCNLRGIREYKGA